jgi:hypothetical protein
METIFENKLGELFPLRHKEKGRRQYGRVLVLNPQGADPPPLPLRVATAGKNRLYEEITPLLPTGIGKRYC